MELSEKVQRNLNIRKNFQFLMDELFNVTGTTIIYPEKSHAIYVNEFQIKIKAFITCVLFQTFILVRTLRMKSLQTFKCTTGSCYPKAHCGASSSYSSSDL